MTVAGHRDMPHSIEAERSVLGAVLISPTALDSVAAELAADDFYLPAHRDIFDAMLAVAGRSQPVDPTLLVDELRSRGALPRLEGGEAYLMALATGVPTAENVGHYARVVKEKADVRGALNAAAALVAHGQSGASPADLADAAEQIGRKLRPQPAPWEPVIPFGRYELPAFPVECMPKALGEMVAATAEATQTPPDMAGMLVLSALSVCCGGRTDVEIAAGYSEPLNSYVAVAMEPGNRKTAVARLVSMPIEDFAREQLERLGPQVARERAEREALEERLKHLKNQAARAEDADERSRLRADAGDLAELLERTPRPDLPRLLADDVTPEVVPLIMAANGGRLGIISAEGGLFDTIAGRYSNGVPNLDVFLKGHAGDPIRVDRRNGTALHIDAPALTIGLAIQPDVLQGLASKPGFTGRGLTPRFWYSLPGSLIGSRQPFAQPAPSNVCGAYADCLRSLLQVAPPSSGGRHRLRLSAAAVERWRTFYSETERAMRPDGALAGIREWASKLPGAVGRIAGLLHCAEMRGPVGAVSASSMEGAIELGRYLSQHARAAHDAMGADPAVEDARRFVAWIERRQLAAFSVREAYQALKGGRIRKVQDLEPALKAAEAHGYVRQTDPSWNRRPGRPGSPRYDANPEILRTTMAPQSPQNPQNPGGSAGRGEGDDGPAGSFVSSSPSRPGEVVL